jgi:hypothetical protein
MAVLIEAISVVIRCEAIVKKFMGGVEAFMASLPNKTLCSDGELACVNFMVPTDVQAYVEYLTKNRLTYKQSDESVDIVVVDQQLGMTTVCSWYFWGQSRLSDAGEIGEIPRAQRFPGRPTLGELFLKQEKQDKTVRNKQVETAHMQYGYTLKEIADQLHIHYTTVSKVLKGYKK